MLNRAIVEISGRALASLLQLPHDSVITAVRLDPFTSDAIQLVVDHRSMPGVNEGEMPMVVQRRVEWR